MEFMDPLLQWNVQIEHGLYDSEIKFSQMIVTDYIKWILYFDDD